MTDMMLDQNIRRLTETDINQMELKIGCPREIIKSWNLFRVKALSFSLYVTRLS